MKAMADKPVLIGISGALRQGSTNTMLVREAARAFGDAAFHLADLNLPLYDGDLEAADGVPAPVMDLAERIKTADAVAISTPEYNKAPSGVLKNALDWLSRTKLAPFEGKPVAIMSAAAGRSGGERAQSALRLMLAPFGALVLPKPEVMIAGSRNAFDADGRLKDENSFAQLEKLMASLRTKLPNGSDT